MDSAFKATDQANASGKNAGEECNQKVIDKNVDNLVKQNSIEEIPAMRNEVDKNSMNHSANTRDSNEINVNKSGDTKNIDPEETVKNRNVNGCNIINSSLSDSAAGNINLETDTVTDKNETIIVIDDDLDACDPKSERNFVIPSAQDNPSRTNAATSDIKKSLKTIIIGGSVLDGQKSVKVVLMHSKEKKNKGKPVAVAETVGMKAMKGISALSPKINTPILRQYNRKSEKILSMPESKNSSGSGTSSSEIKKPSSKIDKLQKFNIFKVLKQNEINSRIEASEGKSATIGVESESTLSSLKDGSLLEAMNVLSSSLNHMENAGKPVKTGSEYPTPKNNLLVSIDLEKTREILPKEISKNIERMQEEIIEVASKESAEENPQNAEGQKENDKYENIESQLIEMFKNAGPDNTPLSDRCNNNCDDDNFNVLDLLYDPFEVKHEEELPEFSRDEIIAVIYKPDKCKRMKKSPYKSLNILSVNNGAKKPTDNRGLQKKNKQSTFLNKNEEPILISEGDKCKSKTSEVSKNVEDDKTLEHTTKNINFEVVTVKTEPDDSSYYENAIQSTTSSNSLGLKMENFNLRLKRNYPPIKKTKVGGKMVYKCSECDYIHPTSLTGLRRHMIRHQPADLVRWYHCELCDYKAKRRGNLIVHMILHRNPEEVIWHSCDICDKKFKHRNGLREHLLRHKKREEMEMHKCDKCSYETPFKHTLLRHKLVHNPLNRTEFLKCNKCPYVTYNKYYLSRHQLSHGDALYKCLLCPYSGKYKSNLEGHMIIHNPNEELFYCDICDYLTNRKYNLTVHHRTAHNIFRSQGEEILHCNNCSYKTKFKRCLVKHMSIHGRTMRDVQFTKIKIEDVEK